MPPRTALIRRTRSVLTGLLTTAMLTLGITVATATPAAANTDAMYWAVVDSAGNLVRSSGAVGITKFGTGRYDVHFEVNMDLCSYTATIGDPGTTIVYTPGLAFTASGHLRNRNVYVETKNLAGGLANYPFHLQVVCPNEPGYANVNASFAVVNASGIVVRGRNAGTVFRISPGRYDVNFNHNLLGCSWVATIGDPGFSYVYHPGQISANRGRLTSYAAYVETRNVSGVLTDFPFHLQVRCPASTSGTWAVVDSDAGYTYTRGSNLSGVTRLGSGRYEVRFQRKMAHCNFVATIGDPFAGAVTTPALAFTARRIDTALVYVETKNMAGGLSDFPFHLHVGGNC
ncbi:hypothetical protein AB0M35_21100 [Micromonospora sp. NPDC051196]|uniref:hypothetical protein n=1 Tax=Micromonospora sp. NPDC051196 TaxID=3155281 RepID=UPI003445CE29